jgi:purine-binding chemotaxis protein CheW
VSTSPADAVARVLQARAAELARVVEDRQDDRVALLVLDVGGQQVALPVEALREVRAPAAVLQVPGTSPELAGLTGGHGAALAAASLAGLLGLATAVPPDAQWLAVLDHPLAPLGLLVDAAVDIVAVERADLSPAPSADGLVVGLVPGGALVLSAAALLQDTRLFLAPSHPTKEPT